MVNYLSPQGLKLLSQELKKLLETERPQVVRAVSEAAAQGDRSENAEYIYGKKRLREIDRRIRHLKKRLENIQVVQKEEISTEVVRFGALITIENTDNGKIQEIQIMGPDEFDPTKGRITHQSPMGRTLLGKKVGDLVAVKGPEGNIEYEVLKIKRPKEF